jgi:hypothetical protein
MQPNHFQYREILRTLNRFSVDYIVIGGVCAAAHGAPVTTFDLDVVHSRCPENIDRILNALDEMTAEHREPGSRRLKPKRSALIGAGPVLFVTKYGSLDFIGEAGGRGFEELLPHSIEVALDEDFRVRLLDLETLVEIKEQTNRPKDLLTLPILRETLAEKRRQATQ